MSIIESNLVDNSIYYKQIEGVSGDNDNLSILELILVANELESTPTADITAKRIS